MRISASLIGTLPLCMILASCAATPRPLATPPRNDNLAFEISTIPGRTPGDTVEVSNPAASTGSDTVRVTPASRLVLNKAQSFDQSPAGIDHKVFIPADTYTRLLITARDGQIDTNGTSTPASEDGRTIYPYKTRSGFERFFVGRRHSETLSVKIVSGDFTATVPLITLSHDSTRSDGEVFSRSIYHVARNFPLFLVRGTGSGDIASATVTVKGTDKTESNAAGAALGAVMAATSLIASPPALLTKLSADSNRAVATSIDGTISSLFAMTLSEEQIVDEPVKTWTPVTIYLKLPRREGHWNSMKSGSNPTEGNLEYIPIGTWRIYFDDPRVSAFSTVSLRCASADDCSSEMQAARGKAKAEIATHLGDVLHFPVIANADRPITLGAYLKQQDWWTPQIQKLSQGKPEDVDQFCRQIRSTLSEIGFNTFDGYAAVQAVAASSYVTIAETGLIKKANSCNAPTGN